MKCLAVNTYDSGGGAARAAYRLHRGLMEIGIESRMLVQDRLGDDPSVIGPETGPGKLFSKLRQQLDSIPLRLLGARPEAVWGLSWLQGRWVELIKGLDPDVIHLHWIGDGFIPVADLPRLNRPVVWTIHDSWPFTWG
ncbi:MAG: glycosyltransferase [Firmicutes bacterium]|nr:glycosyltransferase [Bacillota bacterium]